MLVSITLFTTAVISSITEACYSPSVSVGTLINRISFSSDMIVVCEVVWWSLTFRVRTQKLHSSSNGFFNRTCYSSWLTNPYAISQKELLSYTVQIIYYQPSWKDSTMHIISDSICSQYILVKSSCTNLPFLSSFNQISCLLHLQCQHFILILHPWFHHGNNTVDFPPQLQFQ